ncbi:CBS domain-containing protein [Amycolatopsis aidingensis]|uniref:CBS domain-containing protein n=1 Tax=Amycolatopsis aidingensis TaxID=2842453 RepID=UPI001C0CD7CB|nr:CBS domain-containing protein [Amycolatopsis aidingensis]
MRGPRVADLMTEPVVTVVPRIPFKEIVSVLAAHRIGAVPVVDSAGRPIGVVSEGDLLGRPHGTTALELMNRKVRTIGRQEPLAEATGWLAAGRLRRLYVVDGSGRLVVVLARCDLLSVFLQPDDEIRTVVEREVIRRGLWAEPAQVVVGVRDGVVTLTGRVGRRSEAARAVALTGALPGVVAVHNKCRFAFDDLLPHGR